MANLNKANPINCGMGRAESSPREFGLGNRLEPGSVQEVAAEACLRPRPPLPELLFLRSWALM